MIGIEFVGYTDVECYTSLGNAAVCEVTGGIPGACAAVSHTAGIGSHIDVGNLS